MFAEKYLSSGAEYCNLMPQNKAAVFLYKFSDLLYAEIKELAGLGWAKSTIALNFAGYGNDARDTLGTEPFGEEQKNEMAKSAATVWWLRVYTFGIAGGVGSTIKKLYDSFGTFDGVYDKKTVEYKFLDTIKDNSVARAWAKTVDQLLSVGFGVWPRTFPARTVKEMLELVARREVLTHFAKAMQKTLKHFVIEIPVSKKEEEAVGALLSVIPAASDDEKKAVKKVARGEIRAEIKADTWEAWLDLSVVAAKITEYALRIKYNKGERTKESILEQLLLDSEQKLIEEVGNFLAVALARMPDLFNKKDMFGAAPDSSLSTVLYVARSIKALGYAIRLIASAGWGEDNVNPGIFQFQTVDKCR
jgi:hypothetical protein